MEELLQILFSIIFFGFLLLSNRRKGAKKEKEAAPAEVEFPLPQSEIPGPQRRNPRPTSVKPNFTHPTNTWQSELHPDSQEVIHPFEGNRPKQPPRKSIKPHVGQTLQATSEAPKSPIMEDFDARKAVIWAEIMHPKFEEEL